MLAKQLLSLTLCMMTGVSSMITVHCEEPDSGPSRVTLSEETHAGAKGRTGGAKTSQTAEEDNYYIDIFDYGVMEWIDYVMNGEVVNPISGLSWDNSTHTLTMNNLAKKTYRFDISCEYWSSNPLNLVLNGANELCYIRSWQPLRISGSGSLTLGGLDAEDFELASGTLNLDSKYLEYYFVNYPTDEGVGPALYADSGDETNLHRFSGGNLNISGDYTIGVDQFLGNIRIENTDISIDIPKWGEIGMVCGIDNNDGEIFGGDLKIGNSRLFIRTNKDESFQLFCYKFTDLHNNLAYYTGKNTIQKMTSANRFFVYTDEYSNMPAYVRCTYDFPGQNCVLITDEFQFEDAADHTKYFYEPVYWAYENDITTGTSPITFSPDDKVTRAAIVTFLYRAAGSPEVSGDMPFKDVKAGAYYEKAVLWAVKEGITTGTSATTFAPNESCTRAQIVTFLYRYAGSPGGAAVNPFTDVKASAFYYQPVIWAYSTGVTTGTSATKFSPNDTCTRGQAVTFLYRVEN